MDAVMSDLSRRDFLHVTAGAMTTAGLRSPDAELRTTDYELGTSSDGSVAEGWFDGPMRWVQLTLVENDPGNFDPAFWLDYFKKLHADAATLSAGGIVAYYPTEVPLHHRSAWLARAIPSGRCCMAAVRSACAWSPERTRTPRATR